MGLSVVPNTEEHFQSTEVLCTGTPGLVYNSLYGLGWHGIYGDLPAFTPQVLQLKAYITIPGLI